MYINIQGAARKVATNLIGLVSLSALDMKFT